MSKEANMTSGSLGDKIFKYALTVIATGILQQLFNSADIAVIGRFCGTYEQAAVGSNSPIISVFITLFIGIAVGSNVVIARVIGSGDRDKTSRAVHTSIIISLIIGTALAVIGEIASKGIVTMLKVPPEVEGFALRYLRIYMLGMPAIMLYNFETAIFRSYGDTRTPLVLLAASGVINVGLNVLLVTVFKMNVAGVAIATIASNVFSAAVLLICLFKTDSDVKLSFNKMKIDTQSLGEILRIGVPSGMQSMMSALSLVLIQSSVNSLGTTVMAGISSASGIECFTGYIPAAFGVACSTFVSQNYGSGDIVRCRRSAKYSMLQALALTGSLVLLMWMFSRQLLGIFNPDPDVIEAGRVRLFFMFLTNIICVPEEVLAGHLRSFGITISVTIGDFLGFFAFRIFWIFVVFRANRDLATLMKVFPLGMAIVVAFIVLITVITRPTVKYLKNNPGVKKDECNL